MKSYLVEIVHKYKTNNEKLLKEIHLLGYKNVTNVLDFKIYRIICKLNIEKIKFICEKLLIDPIIETYKINPKNDLSNNKIIIHTWYKPSVLDVVGLNIIKGIRYLGITTQIEVSSGTGFVIQYKQFKLDKHDIEKIVKKLFINELIQEYETL